MHYLSGSKVIAKVFKRRERQECQNQSGEEMTKAEVRVMRHEKDSTGPDG